MLTVSRLRLCRQRCRSVLTVIGRGGRRPLLISHLFCLSLLHCRRFIRYQNPVRLIVQRITWLALVVTRVFSFSLG